MVEGTKETTRFLKPLQTIAGCFSGKGLVKDVTLFFHDKHGNETCVDSSAWNLSDLDNPEPLE